MNAPQIVGLDGKPMQTRSRVSMLAGGGNAPYDAADVTDPHLAAWMPSLGSPDTDLNAYRDRIVARVRDLVRNDGWASAGITRILDNAVGANFRPVAKPDYRALAHVSGNKAFDADWATEFGRALDAHWRAWAQDLGRYCDVQRALTMPQVFRLAYRHKLIDGDALAMIAWKPERVALGRARYATAVQLIDPDRLSNPMMMFDQDTTRGGVEIDRDGAAVAYWIRRAHPADYWAGPETMEWQRVPRETSWGRPVIVHDFEHERAGQHRGGAGVFAPVIERLKMLIKYDGVELDAAIVNAIFSAYVESPFDSSFVEEALGDCVELNSYQKLRTAFHNERRLMLGDVRLPTLFPGEKITSVSAVRPTSNFRDFEGAVLRNVAGCIGVSAQQLSQDWSDVNYSSARAALLEAWKTLTRRRADFAQGFAYPVRAAWLEESFEVDELPLPANAPPFIECRGLYARCSWIGPGRGWIDPVAEKQGAVLGMDAGLSTLEMECAESVGEDWEDMLDQRKRELAYPDGSREVYEQSRTVKTSRYRLVGRTGRDGLGLTLSYNDKDELTGITDGAENTIRIETVNGRVAAIYRIGLHGSRDEAIAQYTYSPEGDLIEHRDVLHHARTYVYQHHLLTRYTDFNGNPANLEWDALGRSAATSAQSRCVRTWIAKDTILDREMNVHALAPKEDTRFEYHREHWYTKVTDSEGNATIHRYDQHNRIILVEHPDGTSDAFNWNENNQLVSTKNALGQVQRFEYDEQGRVFDRHASRIRRARQSHEDHLAEYAHGRLAALWFRPRSRRSRRRQAVGGLRARQAASGGEAHASQFHADARV
ncbi:MULTISPECIES: phage portal protein [Caballeronia]|uniref:phage portal protein n=1 Tax=Caballeronia TaxID=1827195 RepID=UPI00025BA5D3|nr:MULTISPECIES: phage portal protein [Caballeronia]EKS67890.1 phage portal protein [Burkholderia sp. SJ98]